MLNGYFIPKIIFAGPSINTFDVKKIIYMYIFFIISGNTKRNCVVIRHPQLTHFKPSRLILDYLCVVRDDKSGRQRERGTADGGARKRSRSDLSGERGVHRFQKFVDCASGAEELFRNGDGLKRSFYIVM